MIQRFAYLNTWEKLDNGAFTAVFNYALDIAKSESKDLTLIVNNVKQCSDFIDKFMNKISSNKLQKGDVLSYKGVNISLKSPFSLKNHQNYGVFCAFHPSDKAISSMESTSEPLAIVALGEHEEHLNTWVKNNNVQLLAQS